MILRNTDYATLSEIIKNKRKRVIIYGAGMIGQTFIPYFLMEYKLCEYVDCFVDADRRKAGKVILIGDDSFEIRTPDYLYRELQNYIILITNSKFFSVLNFLDNIKELDEVEGYIVPIMRLNELNHTHPFSMERRFNNPMIPKRIHYCWFGGNPIPQFLQECMLSWREKCPDYEIVGWTEKNYDVDKYRFTKEAYNRGKYGFVSDVARLDILYQYGGIYLDTDVALLKNLDDLLYQPGFIGVEKWGNINTGGGCGFVKKHPMLKVMLDYRDQFGFIMGDGTLNQETNGLYETKLFMKAGFKPDNTMQIINNITVYPSCVFHPYDYMSHTMDKNHMTMSVHHFYGGWMDESDRSNRKNTKETYEKILKRIGKAKE